MLHYNPVFSTQACYNDNYKLMNHLTNSKGIIIMKRTITAATLVVHYSWQLSDADVQKLAKRNPGGSTHTLACLIMNHDKFSLDVTKNSDGTFDLKE